LLCIELDRGARGLVEAVAIASVVSCGVLLVRLLIFGKGKELA
jgi:multidrug resistance protein, MATE family